VQKLWRKVGKVWRFPATFWLIFHFPHSWFAKMIKANAPRWTQRGALVLIIIANQRWGKWKISQNIAGNLHTLPTFLHNFCTSIRYLTILDIYPKI
jgi:hypothetical protein